MPKSVLDPQDVRAIRAICIINKLFPLVQQIYTWDDERLHEAERQLLSLETSFRDLAIKSRSASNTLALIDTRVLK